MTSSDTTFDLGSNQQLRIIEWHQLDLIRFYPVAMISSWSVRCLVYPFSVVKSRMQLQRQNTVYRNTVHAFTDIVKYEGFTTLYRGFWVTLPQLAASFIYSTVYERLRAVLHNQLHLQSDSLVSAIAGAAASTCTQTIFVPTDIIAQHMMVHNSPKAFMSSSTVASCGVIEQLRRDGGSIDRRLLGLRIIRAIYRADGLRGFYRGFLSSAGLYIPSSMVFWATYYKMQELLRILNADGRSTGLFIDQGIAGAVGGACAAICTNPLDVYRVRIQVHRTTYVETLRRMIRYEGWHMFTKGLAPRMFSNATHSCLIMIVYETVKKMCVLPEYRDSIVW